MGYLDCSEWGATEYLVKIMPKLGKMGLRLIRNFEGLRLKAYRDAGGVWTIGYGHTGPDVKPGLVITEKWAEILLKYDVERFERAVAKAVHVQLTPNQFDALVSFSYNLGAETLRTSLLLKLLNVRDFAGAAAQFERFNKVKRRNRAGDMVWVVLVGLVKRREAERKLFEEEVKP